MKFMQNNSNKKKAVQSAAASAIIWGLGQFINGQKIKGIIYFIIQIFAILNISKIINNIRGLITLGDTEMLVKGSKVLDKGDNSIIMLLFGLIYLIIAIILILIYISNIRDAYKRQLQKCSVKQLPDGMNFLKHLGNEGFPYLVLIPSMIMLIAFSVIPNIFSFLIAYRNTNKGIFPYL
jgi:arabinogalactan oligomer/maltooligosaccharide transport system permease protein